LAAFQKPLQAFPASLLSLPVELHGLPPVPRGGMCHATEASQILMRPIFQ
jgi:hypothetical protein